MTTFMLIYRLSSKLVKLTFSQGRDSKRENNSVSYWNEIWKQINPHQAQTQGHIRSQLEWRLLIYTYYHDHSVSPQLYGGGEVLISKAYILH